MTLQFRLSFGRTSRTNHVTNAVRLTHKPGISGHLGDVTRPGHGYTRNPGTWVGIGFGNGFGTLGGGTRSIWERERVSAITNPGPRVWERDWVWERRDTRPRSHWEQLLNFFENLNTYDRQNSLV